MAKLGDMSSNNRTATIVLQLAAAASLLIKSVARKPTQQKVDDTSMLKGLPLLSYARTHETER